MQEWLARHVVPGRRSGGGHGDQYPARNWKRPVAAWSELGSPAVKVMNIGRLRLKNAHLSRPDGGDHRSAFPDDCA